MNIGHNKWTCNLNSNRTGSTQNTEVHAAINNKRSTLSVILQVSSVDFRRKQVKHIKHYNYSLYHVHVR